MTVIVHRAGGEANLRNDWVRGRRDISGFDLYWCLKRGGDSPGPTLGRGEFACGTAPTSEGSPASAERGRVWRGPNAHPSWPLPRSVRSPSLPGAPIGGSILRSGECVHHVPVHLPPCLLSTQGPKGGRSPRKLLPGLGSAWGRGADLSRPPSCPMKCNAPRQERHLT